MELRQFKYFLSIVDHRSLSRAAQHLYVAQSALSKQVAELESELGVKLLLRRANGVVMTEAGKIFYEYAQGITKHVANAREAVHHAPGDVVGSVVAALPQSTSAMLALPLLRAARRRYPKITFQLNEELTGYMADQLLSGRVDVAIFTTAMPIDEMECTPLVEEDFVYLHAAGDLPAPPPGSITLAQALERPLIMPSKTHGDGTRSFIEAALEAQGLHLRDIAAEISSVHILKSAVEAGIGPSIMPIGLAQAEVAQGRLVARRIEGDPIRRRLVMCVSPRLPTTPATSAICGLIADVATELCASGQWPGARRITQL